LLSKEIPDVLVISDVQLAFQDIHYETRRGGIPSRSRRFGKLPTSMWVVHAADGLAIITLKGRRSFVPIKDL
jgi:hypothetical protein